MTRYSRKKGNNRPNKRIGKRGLKTKTYKKDLDLIKEQLINTIKDNDFDVVINASKVDKPSNEEDVDLDLPANGQYFCQHCE